LHRVLTHTIFIWTLCHICD